MSEIKSHIEQMLAEAEAKEHERQIQTKQTKTSSEMEKISTDRSEQIARHEQSTALSEQEIADTQTKRKLEVELGELESTHKEVEAKMANPDLGEEARAIYQKALDTVQNEQARIHAEIQGLIKDNTLTYRENEEYINRTNKEAAEILSYKGNQFPKIAEHIEQLRELQHEVPEISRRINLDQLANQIYERIITGRGSHINDRRKYTYELNKDSYQDPKFPQELIDNPYVARALRDKVFERIEALKQKQESYDRQDSAFKEISTQLENALGSSVKVKYKKPDSKNEVETSVWSGGSFWDGKEARLTTYDTEAMRLPNLEYDLYQSLSEEQRAKIEEAVNNPRISLEKLRDELGYKFNEDALGSIMAEAQKENQQFDAEAAEKDRLQKIENVRNQIEKVKEDLKLIEGRKQVSLLADQYRKLEDQLQELDRNKRAYGDAIRHQETAQRELDKIEKDTNFLGMVKDRAGKSRLEMEVKKYQSEAEEYMHSIQQAPSSLERDAETLKRRLFEQIIEFQATGYAYVTVDLATAENNADEYVRRYLDKQNTWNKEDQNSEQHDQNQLKLLETALKELEGAKA